MTTVFKVDAGCIQMDKKAIIDLMTGSTSVRQQVEERRQVQVANSILKARVAEERRK